MADLLTNPMNPGPPSQVQAPPSPARHNTPHAVEILISTLLRVGVVTSLTIVVGGTILSFAHHRDYIRDPAELHQLTKPGAPFPHSVARVWEGVTHLRGQAVVVVGLVLLIATPVLRVAVSILAFAIEKDRVFMVITTVVLLLLLLSFVLGRVE
jgi:uncharacterized membrane protein